MSALFLIVGSSAGLSAPGAVAAAAGRAVVAGRFIPDREPPTAPNSSCYPSGGSFHCYAVGFDNTHGPYDGIGVTRSDINISGITAGSSCTSPPTAGWSFPGGGGVVYQSQWVTTGTQGDWVELGTGHRCTDAIFWYWGYGFLGGWYPLGVKDQAYIGPHAQHRFSLYRTAGAWHYEVDNTVMQASTSWGTTSGSSIQFGLESWDPNASTTGQPYSGISYLATNGLSYAISGRQSTRVDPWMCGQWSSDTQWWAGEGSGCGYQAATASAAVGAIPAPTATAIPLSKAPRPGAGLDVATLTADCGSVAKDETDLWGTAESVVGAYGSSAKAVTAWKSQHLAKSGRKLEASQTDADGPVAVCAIQGDYQIPAPPPGPGAAPVVYDLAIVTVDSHGDVKPFAFGNASTLADLLTPPAAS